MSTFGPTYNEQLDGVRLQKQHVKIRELMMDRQWRTLSEISQALRYPESSVSAQLRHLRKAEFGGHIVDKRRRGNTGLWEYRVENRRRYDEMGQGYLLSLPEIPMRGH